MAKVTHFTIELSQLELIRICDALKGQATAYDEHAKKTNDVDYHNHARFLRIIHKNLSSTIPTT
jgi:hypothetical protein